MKEEIVERVSDRPMYAVTRTYDDKLVNRVEISVREVDERWEREYPWQRTFLWPDAYKRSARIQLILQMAGPLLEAAQERFFAETGMALT